MKCLAVCQNDLVMRTLNGVLSPTFDVEFLVESRPLARRLTEEGLKATATDCARCDSYLKVDLTPSTCVIVEDTGRRSLKRLISAVRDAGGTLTYVVSTGTTTRRADEAKAAFPDIFTLTLAQLLAPQLHAELERSVTRARVLQYQRYFSDADRVLILLHNEPDPDAMASGLALRSLLRRTKTTAIIGAVQGVTRPENVRMAHLLDIQVEKVTPDQFAELRPRGDRRRAAALLRGAAASTWIWSWITTRSSRATAPSSRTSAPTTVRPARSSPNTCARRT